MSIDDPFESSTEDEDLEVPDVEEDEDEEDVEFDFDHLFPADGAYEVEVKHVAYRSYDNENTGRHVLALNVTLQLQTDDEFNGQYVTDFIYLGENKFTPMGVKKLKTLCDAVGVPCEGQVKLSQFGPTWQTVGKRREKILTAFTGLSCGANIATTEETIKGEDRMMTKVLSYISPEILAEIKDAGDPSKVDF